MNFLQTLGPLFYIYLNFKRINSHVKCTHNASALCIIHKLLLQIIPLSILTLFHRVVERQKSLFLEYHQTFPTLESELVKLMQGKGRWRILWIIFDHVKHLKNQMTMACHVYDGQYCKVLTIVCRDMQFEDVVAHMFFLEN